MEKKLQELLLSGKAVSLDQKFEGTYDELKSLIDDGTIVPVIQNDMLVGFQYVGATSFAEDQLLERQFITAYWDKPVMEWVNEILGLVEPGQSVTLRNPQELDLDNDAVATAVKYLLGHFLKRGTNIEIQKDGDDYLVTDIHLGRKLTADEKNRLARKLLDKSNVDINNLYLA